MLTPELQPYAIVFYPQPLVAPGWQLRWVRFYKSLADACADVPAVVRREYPNADVRVIALISREEL